MTKHLEFHGTSSENDLEFGMFFIQKYDVSIPKLKLGS